MNIYLFYDLADAGGAENLCKFLIMLKRNKLIDYTCLSDADLILVLVSPNLLMYGADLQIWAEQNSNKIAIPILYSECDWECVEHLSKLQHLPRDRGTKHVYLKDADDGVWTDVAREIKFLAERFKKEVA